MNKAFVREPDNTDPYCPGCGALGEQVALETLVAQIGSEAAATLEHPASFCPTPSCAVAYFDALETTVPITALTQPRYPKDAAAPLCACFGLTLEDVEEDIRDGKPSRIRELLDKSKSPDAHCLTAAPTGRCCLPEVQRVYFRRQAELKSLE